MILCAASRGEVPSIRKRFNNFSRVAHNVRWGRRIAESGGRGLLMKRLFQLSCLAVAFLLRPAPAAADSLTFTGLGSGSWVTISYGSVTETGWAGEIDWLLKTPSN